MSQSTTRSRSRSAIAAHPITSAAIAILVVADIFFPFFYWYLLIFMPITSLVLWLATFLQKRLVAPGGSESGDAQ
jgi:hypothetical protein